MTTLGAIIIVPVTWLQHIVDAKLFFPKAPSALAALVIYGAPPEWLYGEMISTLHGGQRSSEMPPVLPKSIACLPVYIMSAPAVGPGHIA